MAKTVAAAVGVNLISEAPIGEWLLVSETKVLGSTCSIMRDPDGQMVVLVYRGWMAILSLKCFQTELVIAIEEELRKVEMGGDNGDKG